MLKFDPFRNLHRVTQTIDTEFCGTKFSRTHFQYKQKDTLSNLF